MHAFKQGRHGCDHNGSLELSPSSIPCYAYGCPVRKTSNLLLRQAGIQGHYGTHFFFCQSWFEEVVACQITQHSSNTGQGTQSAQELYVCHWKVATFGSTAAGKSLKLKACE